jgi:hypothetical protein
MKYIFFIFGLFLSAQASWSSVLYTFAVNPEEHVPAVGFSFDKSTFLNGTTAISGSDLENISGVPPGVTLDSVLISYFGPLITVTEDLNGLPLTFVFTNGPWNKTGSYDSFLDLSQMTISDPGSAAPEPGQFGLLLAGGALVIGFWRHAANSSRKSRS